MTFPIALALVVAQAVAATPASSLQQEFDAATAAAEAHDCAKAVPMFEALERQPQVKAGSISASAIAVRKGKCLISLSRASEGEAAILAGLPRLERGGATFVGEIAESYLIIGNVALLRGDFAEARRRLEQALARQTGTERLATLSLLAKAGAFEPGPQPLAYAEEAQRIALEQTKPSKDLLAALHTLHARILLNRGQTQEAYAELKQALAFSGGLTPKTTLAEASMRGDLALAALLLGKKDDARRYLAWTGAGRIAESPFTSAALMAPPECGEETGLKPEDSAVVEFAIAEDGSVAAANTIYTRGGPRVAAAFSRAVDGWLWKPEDLAKIPRFYRLATRVEVRCTTSGGPTPAIVQPLFQRFAGWAAMQLGEGENGTTEIDLARMEAILKECEARGDAAGQAAAAGMIFMSNAMRPAQTVPMLDRAIVAASGGGAAALQRPTLRAMRAMAVARSSDSERRRQNALIAAATAMNQDPEVSRDPLAINTLRLVAGTPGRTAQQSEVSDTFLRQVIDDARLPDRHPLRQVALVKLANRVAAAGDLNAAQALFSRTGLSEQQCALIGAKQAMRSTGANASDFPLEALQYGFDGWVRLEFDIKADGRTASPRALIAYPPFIFVDAATKMASDIRYESAFRPSGGVACNANLETIAFRAN